MEGLNSADNIGALKGFSDIGKEHWAYYDIVEASNSHKYRGRVAGRFEIWTHIYED